MVFACGLLLKATEKALRSIEIGLDRGMVALGEQEQEVEDGPEDFFAAFNGKEAVGSCGVYGTHRESIHIGRRYRSKPHIQALYRSNPFESLYTHIYIYVCICIYT